MKKRYSTKNFDPKKKIDDDLMDDLESLLQLAPSSTNIQPWHFVIADTQEGKERIAKATEGFFKFNEKKILDASAVVIFTTKIDIEDEFLESVTGQEESDGRFPNDQVRDETHNGRKMFAGIHKNEIKDLYQWSEKQVYLNLGTFLLGVAHLGLDALPMEGLHMNMLDTEFGLTEKGLKSSVVVAVGYGQADDYNKHTPKSRLDKSQIITRV